MKFLRYPFINGAFVSLFTSFYAFILIFTSNHAYTGLSGRQFRRHPDIKPETSGHLIDQLDFTLKLIVVQCFSYHHKSVNLISLIVFSAITSRMDFFESRARIYVL